MGNIVFDRSFSSCKRQNLKAEMNVFPHRAFKSMCAVQAHQQNGGFGHGQVVGPGESVRP